MVGFFGPQEAKDCWRRTGSNDSCIIAVYDDVEKYRRTQEVTDENWIGRKAEVDKSERHFYMQGFEISWDI